MNSEEVLRLRRFYAILHIGGDDMKKISLIILSIILVFSLSGCLSTKPTKIDSSDFENAKSLLEEQYELTLSDSATFIGGYFDNAFRDPSVIVVFTIEQADFEMMFSENWVESGYIDEPNSFLVDSDVLESFSTDKKLDYQGAQFTFLWCDALENDTYRCVFCGHHPKENF